MPTHYSVVQYVPDPLTGERINIGIIAVGDSEIASRFLDSWARVECFAAGHSVDFLRDFAEEIQAASPAQLGLSGLTLPEDLTVETLQNIACRWTNAVQFTTPATSLKQPAELLAGLAPRFLRTTTTATSIVGRPRDRRRAAAIAHSALSLAVEYQQMQAQVKRRTLIRGALEEYRFDSVALNGRPLLAAHGISFESGGDDVERSVDALGQAIRDVRDHLEHLQIGVVALRREEDENSRPFKRAVHIFETYGARVLREDEVQDWAIDAAAKYMTGEVPGAEDGELSLLNVA
jgi:hypothetical protein